MLIFKKNILFIIFLFTASLHTIFSQEKIDSLDFYLEQKDLVKALDLINSFNQDTVLIKYDEKYVEIKIKESNLFADLSDYEKSIEILYRTLIKIKSNTNKTLQTKIYLELGTQYSAIKDTLNSFKNYHIAEKIAENINDYSVLRHIYHNLFRLHVLKNKDSALFYIKKKYVLDKKNNDNSGIAITYNNFFAYHSVKNEYDTAKKYLDSAYQTSVKYNIKHAIRTSLSNYGYFYSVKERDFKKALDYYNILEAEHEKDLTQSELSNLFLNLGYVYENLGDYANANLYHVLYIELSQKIYNEEIGNTIKDIESKYKIDQIQKDYLEEKNKILAKESRNKKLILFIIFLFLMTLFISYAFFQNMKLKARNREKEIDSIIQKKIINANIDGQEKERKLIATLLHDQISALLSSAGLHLKAFESKLKIEVPTQDLIKTKSIIKDAHDQIRNLSHQLIPPVLAKLGLNEALQDLCEKNSNTMIEFIFSGSTNPIKLNKDFEIKIYFVVSELINNIIKHSEANSAKITYEINEKFLKIIVQDNGIGMYNNENKKEGLGLQQTSTRIFGLNGEMLIENSNGLKINITIPLDSDAISEFNNL